MRAREIRDEVRGEVWFVDGWGRELTEEDLYEMGIIGEEEYLRAIGEWDEE